MANPTKKELISKLSIKGFDDGEIEEAFVSIYGVTPDNMMAEGPLPSPDSWAAPFKPDETPTTLRVKEEQAQVAAQEAEEATKQKFRDEGVKMSSPSEGGDDRFGGLDTPMQREGKTGVVPAVTGLITGAAEEAADVGGMFYFMPEKTDKAYDRSIVRQEDFIRQRSGQTRYENLQHDAWDLIGLLPNIGGLLWNAVTEGDSEAKMKHIAKSFVGDAYMAYPYIAQNFDRSFQAAPLSTIMTAIPLFKAVKGLSKLGPLGVKLDKLGQKISKVMDTEVPGTIKTRTKFRNTGEDVEPGIYDHSLGDRGISVRDIIKSGAKGAAAGFLAGGTPVAVGGAFIAGAGLSPVLGALAKTNQGGAFVNVMSRFLNGISSNMQVSHELAMRNLFAKGPEAEAKLDAIGAHVAKRIREGDDILDAELMDMARKAFPELIADVEFGPSGRQYNKDVTTTVQERVRKRHKLSGELEADLKNAEDLLQGLLGTHRTRQTMSLMDDILSDGSVQFGRADDVRTAALSKMEKELGRALTRGEKESLIKTMESVAGTPFHRQAGINLNLRVGDKSFDLRNLVTEAHRSLKPERRRKILAGLAADIITSNRNQVRKQSFAREAARTADAHVVRLGLDAVELANMPLKDANKLFAMKVMEDVIINRGSVPNVGPTGINMALGGSVLKSFAEAVGKDGVKGKVILEALSKRLGRDLTKAEEAKALRRAKEVADDLIDSDIKDIADEGARAAEQYYSDSDRASIYDRMDKIIDSDLLDADDVKKVESFFKSVDKSASVIKDNRSMRGPLTKAFQWLQNSADSNNAGAVNRILGAHIKASYTTRNINAHINNGMSNIGLLSYDRGTTPMQVLHSIARNASKYYSWTEGNSKGLSGRQKRMMKQIERAGFAAGDITRAEIQNIARMDNMPSWVKNSSSLSKVAGSGAARGVKAIDDAMAGVYRWGDVGPKIDEAIHSMNAVFDRIDSMADGQTWEFRTSPVSTTVVTRRGKGLYRGKRKIADFVKKDGEVFAEGAKLDDLAGQHGRTRANERFFDYRDRPGALRYLDKFGGLVSYINPYLTWAWQAMGIGGDGLFSVVNKTAPEYITNNLKAAAREEFKSAGKWYRRSMVAQGLREQFSQNPVAMRNALGFSDAPGSPLPVLIGMMAGPDVVEARNLESMNPFSREFLKWETILNIGQGAILSYAPGLMTEEERKKNKQRTILQEKGVGKRLIKMGMATGGPLHQLVKKVNEDKYPSAREWLALVIGQTPALGISAAVQFAGGPEDSAFVLINDKLPKESRPAALDFYFRKMFNWGWDKELMVKGQTKVPGRLDKYFSGIKTRVSSTYFKDLISDYRRGKISNDQMVEAEVLAQEAYRERFKEVDEAYELVTGKTLPNRLAKVPKLDYKKANKQ